MFQMLMEIMFDSKSMLKSSLTYLSLVGISFFLFTVLLSAENRAAQESLRQAVQLLSEQKVQAARTVLEELINAGPNSPPQAF